MSYQKPSEGFRGEVTKAAMKAIIHNGHCCPACGIACPRYEDYRTHALDCLELRADVADRL